MPKVPMPAQQATWENVGKLSNLPVRKISVFLPDPAVSISLQLFVFILCPPMCCLLQTTTPRTLFGGLNFQLKAFWLQVDSKMCLEAYNCLGYFYQWLTDAGGWKLSSFACRTKYKTLEIPSGIRSHLARNYTLLGFFTFPKLLSPFYYWFLLGALSREIICLIFLILESPSGKIE